MIIIMKKFLDVDWLRGVQSRHTYKDLREVIGCNKNRIFTMEKRMSVFIGRTIFFASEKFVSAF